MPSITTENYLKTIYQLREKSPEAELVKFGEIAQELKVTPGTITTMMKSLADRGLVDYFLRSGVKLTDVGEQQASNVVRRHRLIELFLVNVLNMNWSDVHEDAEALEHAVSDRVLDRINAMMGHPERDPHGDPIPGNVQSESSAHSLRLSQTDPGHSYMVRRIDNQNSQTLTSVAELGLKPGTSFYRLNQDSSEDPILLQVGDEALRVPTELADCIRVKASS